MNSTCILLHRDTISNHSHIVGVFSSPFMALQAFNEKQKRNPYPYINGNLKYRDKEMLTYALNEVSPNNHSLLVWTNTLTEIYIKWDVVDKTIN